MGITGMLFEKSRVAYTLRPDMFGAFLYSTAPLHVLNRGLAAFLFIKESICP